MGKIMLRFNDLNAKPKLMLSFGLILAFAAGIGLTGAYVLSEQGTGSDLLFKRDVTASIAIKELQLIQARIATSSTNAIIAASAANPKEEVGKQRKQFDGLFNQLQEQTKALSSTIYNQNLSGIIEQISAAVPPYGQHCRLVFDHAEKGDSSGTTATLAANGAIVTKLDSLIREAGKVTSSDLQQSRAELKQSMKTARAVMLSLLAAALFVGLSLSVFISRGFSIPLIFAANVLEELSNGNLTHRLTVTSSDEIGKLGHSLNRAMDSMDRALSEVGTSARDLSNSSQQLARAAEALAAGAQQQAASLEETSASLEEITATICQNSDNAKHATQLAVSSKESAEKGGTSAIETMDAMAEIKASSAKIAEIISTMDEIAFQTNLLSVNASVEAARAGAQGNGFKVVATEVRNLAQRSATAAKEIKALIKGSVRKVENGSMLVTHSGTTLKEIVASVKRVSDIVGEIAAASQEQAVGIEHVGKAMVQMDRVTQSNSAQTEELSATASSLESQSSYLHNLVSRFTLSANVSDPQQTSTGRNRLARTPLKKPAISANEQPTRNLESMAKNVGQLRSEHN